MNTDKELHATAQTIWAEARSGASLLDSQRAVLILVRGLTALRDEYQEQLDTARHEVERAQDNLAKQKSFTRKLVQLVRRAHVTCPVCEVGDTQKHQPFCWFRSATNPVWNRMTDSEWKKRKETA
jgi:hypothetical protein